MWLRQEGVRCLLINSSMPMARYDRELLLELMST